MGELHHVQANGLRFAYLAEGSGPLVLLFHGFPDTAHTWDHVLPRIAARGYRAVAPFTRGYHPTEVPAADADGATLGRDVLALIEALGEGQPAIVVGHDWGATAVYTAASLAPERVKKLVTVAIPHPAAVTPTPRLAWGLRHVFAYKMPGAAARFAKDDFAALRAIYARWSPTWNPPDSELRAIRKCFEHPGSLDAAFGYYRRLELAPPSELRKKISVPTVCFAGTDDPLFTPAHYEGTRRMFTSDFVVEAMPGGHFLHREHPDTFVERLLKHL